MKIKQTNIQDTVSKLNEIAYYEHAVRLPATGWPFASDPAEADRTALDWFAADDTLVRGAAIGAARNGTGGRVLGLSDPAFVDTVGKDEVLPEIKGSPV